MAYFHAIIIGFFAANIWTYFCVFFNVFNRKKYLWFLISSYCYYKHHIVEITYLYSLTCEYSVTKNKKKQTIHKYASYTYIKRPLPFPMECNLSSNTLSEIFYFFFSSKSWFLSSRIVALSFLCIHNLKYGTYYLI